MWFSLSAFCTLRRHLLCTKGSWKAAPATTAAKFAQAAQKWVFPRNCKLFLSRAPAPAPHPASSPRSPSPQVPSPGLLELEPEAQMRGIQVSVPRQKPPPKWVSIPKTQPAGSRVCGGPFDLLLAESADHYYSYYYYYYFGPLTPAYREPLLLRWLSVQPSRPSSVPTPSICSFLAPSIKSCLCLLINIFILMIFIIAHIRYFLYNPGEDHFSIFCVHAGVSNLIQPPCPHNWVLISAGWLSSCACTCCPPIQTRINLYVYLCLETKRTSDNSVGSQFFKDLVSLKTITNS